MLIEKVKNKHGIEIVVCCASCIHNLGALSEKVRACGNGQGQVYPSDSCKHWTMKPELDNAGKGGGPVKKKQYLDYLLDYPKLPDGKRFPVNEVRADYEREHGKIYLTRI